MAGFKNIVQKAFYLGVGLADYAAEKAGFTLQELRVQSQKLADEMVARGEMTTEEARRFVDDLVQQAEQTQTPGTTQTAPRQIEIVSEDEPHQQNEDVDHLRQQVQSLQEELQRIKRR